MINKFFAALLCFTLTHAEMALALTKTEAQQCVETAVNEISRDVNNIQKYLYATEVVKDARSDWRHLSQSQQQQLVTAALHKMMTGLKPFRVFVNMLEIEVDTIRPNGSLSRATGRISILFWRNQPFSAVIDRRCRVRQVTVRTLSGEDRDLSQWTAEKMNWPPP